MKLRFILVSLVLSLSTTAMASGTLEAINAARDAQKQAKAAGFEWTTMGSLVKKAEALAKAGKDKKAIKVANTVVEQGKAASKQAKLAKAAGPRF